VSSQVADERLFIRRGHQAEKVAGVFVIVVSFPVVVAIDFARNLVGQLAVTRILHRA
jgi:hypothetical protein